MPNSHWQIETEITCQVTNDNQINELVSSGMLKKGCELLENRSSVGSLSATDQFTAQEMQRFWFNSQNIKESISYL